MRQLFSVGEEVILCSQERPKFNGEYVVECVAPDGEYVKCRLTGDFIRSDEGGGYGYLLTPSIPDFEGNEILWDQTALRKKHKPSTESFSEMMRNLNTIKV